MKLVLVNPHHVKKSKHQQDRLTKDFNGLKNRISRWLKIYLPEYKEVLGSPYGIGSMVMLFNASLLEDILKLGAKVIKPTLERKKDLCGGHEKS